MSVSWEMTEQDFEDVKHLLPQSVVAMITVIGLEAAFHMVKVWGGTNYPISNRRRNTRQSRILHAQLVEDIGEEAAGRLERAYADQPFLAIPRCWDAMRELRNRFIRRQYDAMSAEGMSDLVIVRELVLAHRLSTRNIRYILKEADREAAARAQTDLFVA